MDLLHYKKLAEPKIISGKMVQLVLDERKRKVRDRFLMLEKKKEDLEPLLDKLDELKDQFDRIPKQNENKQTTVPQGLDLDQGFTEGDLVLLNAQGLESPSQIVKSGRELEALQIINKLNNNLGQQKKKAIYRRELQELDSYSRVNRKLRDRIKMIVDLRYDRSDSAGPMSSKKQTGSGINYRKQIVFTSPEDLVNRFDLLGGSLMSGNNSSAVRNEFGVIAHKLRDLGLLNNRQMLSIAKNFSLKS